MPAGGVPEENRSVIRSRLENQRLARPSRSTVAETVGWFGAVQAQEYAWARWGVGQRAAGLTDAEVERAFDAGEILRTHVMRPTWHFVTPSDIRWLLALTGPRVKAAMASYDRRLELDPKLFAQSQIAIRRALAGGRQLTRTEIGAVLNRARIVAAGQRLARIVMQAELDAVICSGPRRGKQFTYALLDDRAPAVRAVGREEALMELTRRYFTSHGPATCRDFSWWSGLTVKDARTGVDMLGGSLDTSLIDGRTYCSARGRRRGRGAVRAAHLLPVYDEYVIAYRDRDLLRGALVDGAGTAPGTAFLHPVLLDGLIAGTWGRTAGRNGISLEVALYRPATGEQVTRLREEVGRYSRFMGVPATLSVRTL